MNVTKAYLYIMGNIAEPKDIQVLYPVYIRTEQSTLDEHKQEYYADQLDGPSIKVSGSPGKVYIGEGLETQAAHPNVWFTEPNNQSAEDILRRTVQTLIETERLPEIAKELAQYNKYGIPNPFSNYVK